MLRRFRFSGADADADADADARVHRASLGCVGASWCDALRGASSAALPGSLLLSVLLSLLPTAAVFATEGASGLDMKYMYYWDRNGVWNHTPAFAFFKKIAPAWTLTWDQEFDAVSGASRRLGFDKIGTLNDHDLQIDALSSASKREVRLSEQPGVAYAKGGRTAAASLYLSNESDYRSLSPSVSGSMDFNERNTTLGASAAWFFDELSPVGAFAGLGGRRDITSLTASLTQLVTPLTLVGFTANVIHSQGHLGHPYNPVITLSGNLILENLPEQKTSLALAGQWVQGYRIFERLGSIHLEGRYYRDDWKLDSKTLDLQWYQYVSETWYLRLRARGYTQSAAGFAKERYTGDELYRTPDIRYFAFSSLTLGAKVGGTFPESWSDSPLLPDRWDIGYDHGIRDTPGEEDGVNRLYHYQLFPSDEYYIQGTFMAGLSFDF